MIRASVLIVNKRNDQGKKLYLVLKRAEDARLLPGRWTLPGGKVDEMTNRFEDYEETAVRELYEETGIRANSLKAIKKIYVGIEHIIKVFKVKKWFLEQIITYPNQEHITYSWLTKKQISKMKDVGEITKLIIKEN